MQGHFLRLSFSPSHHTCLRCGVVATFFVNDDVNYLMGDPDGNIVVCVSGFFDPVHSGHISYMKSARALGDTLVVILNDDVQKRSLRLASLEERRCVVEAIRWVDNVVVAVDRDECVAETLRLVRPHIFAKGLSASRKEIEVCEELGIKVVANVGSQLHLQDLIAQSR